MADSWFGTTALPTYGCFIPGEDTLHLFPDLAGKRVLDLGCGSGHSLKWCGQQGAAALWGVDLSSRQLENAESLLRGAGYAPVLLHGPMEAPGRLPAGYFDVVYSIYAIGWATDLKAVFDQAAACLKPGGVLIFSWDHPWMHCVEPTEDGGFAFTGSYTADEPFSYIQRGQPVTVQNRRLFTYINALADAGFRTERLVEETDPAVLSRDAAFSSAYYSEYKARKFPLSFVLKARKAYASGERENG
ncbi:MAG TPA: class I SAM-dependent methyltransferase [Firmicutes bacterium]|nr:class I SAM-dependent methyltransferase [Bacillota bacterium]